MKHIQSDPVCYIRPVCDPYWYTTILNEFPVSLSSQLSNDCFSVFVLFHVSTCNDNYCSVSCIMFDALTFNNMMNDDDINRQNGQYEHTSVKL